MDNIIQLLKDYQEFTNKHGTDDFVLFGETLKQKYSQPDTYETNEPTVNEAGLNVIASHILGGLTSFVETWIKLSYEDLPLLSLGDFGIIKTIEMMQTPSKKEVADKQIMERTTCIESMKRLMKAGLLEELTDDNDKRIKRVKLSKNGKALVPKIDQRMMALSNLLMGNLSDMEKKSMIPILKKLSNFHHDLYANKDKVDIKELYNLQN